MRLEGLVCASERVEGPILELTRKRPQGGGSMGGSRDDEMPDRVGKRGGRRRRVDCDDGEGVGGDGSREPVAVDACELRCSRGRCRGDNGGGVGND